MHEGTARRPTDSLTSRSDLSVANHDRLFAVFLAVCGCATVVLLPAGFATEPSSERPELLPVAALAGVSVVLAIWFLRRGFSRRLSVLAGSVLMILGVVVDATLPDGLELRISRLEAKAKLSQNRSDADIEGTITGLTAGSPTERAVAELKVRDLKST
jgi:hypothetical protein